MLAIIISVILMAVIVVLDQVTKYAVVANILYGQSVEVIPGVLNFTYVRNKGAAFGSFDDARWVFMTLSTIAIVAILVYMFWKKPQSKMLLASLIMITGGGIGKPRICPEKRGPPLHSFRLRATPPARWMCHPSAHIFS